MHTVALVLSLFSPGQTIASCPAWESDPGAYETGLIAVPTDKASDILDVVSATGNDAESATVMSWQNRTRRGPSGPFSWTVTDPSWTSNDVGLRTDVVAGRFDDDDELDLVVLEMLGSPSNQHGDVSRYPRGAVKLYRGVDCARVDRQNDDACKNARAKDDKGVEKTWSSFATLASSRIDDVFAVTFAAGDGNGDGRLDVATPLVDDVPLISMRDYETQPKGVPARVYWNKGDGFDDKPWTSSESIAATSAVFADVDGDGFVDVVFGADAIYVHFGHDGGVDKDAGFVGAVPPAFSTTAWMSAMSLDAGWLRKADGSRAFGVVAGWGCPTSLLSGSTCAGGVATYFPTKKKTTATKATTKTAADWAQAPNTGVSHVKLVNLDGAGNVNDILSSAWIEADKSPGRLRAAQAQKSGIPYQANFYTSTDCFVGEAIVAADLNGRSVTQACATFMTPDSKQKVAAGCTRVVLPAGSRALTLPHVNVQRVTAVERKSKSLPLRDWNTVVGTPTVSLREPLKKDEAIVVRYGVAHSTDIVAATWEPSRGVLYFPVYPSATSTSKGTNATSVTSCSCATSPPTKQQKTRGNKWQ